MRILFDHGTPAPLQSFLAGHTVRDSARPLRMMWSGLLPEVPQLALARVQRAVVVVFVFNFADYLRKIAPGTK